LSGSDKSRIGNARQILPGASTLTRRPQGALSRIDAANRPAVCAMPVGQESLLGNTPEQAQCRKHLTWRRICLVVVGLAVAFVGITATYMYSIGALDFSKVRRDLAFNGSHVFEPETHVAFPVQLHTLFNGEKRIQVRCIFVARPRTYLPMRRRRVGKQKKAHFRSLPEDRRTSR